MTRPLCFVLMPYHRKVEDGQPIDFRVVYDRLIAPSIVQAGMEPLRADEDPAGGIFQKSMFERLILCEYAVADLSTGNPNVYYELGVRHALRPHSTVLMFRQGWRLPLDVAHDAAVEYPLGRDGEPVLLDDTRSRLVHRLRHARRAQVDSPVHQLVTGLPVLDVDHSRIDAFRTHADRDEWLRRRLDKAAAEGCEHVREVEADLGDLGDLDIGGALGLMLAYRSASAWAELVRVVRALAAPVARVEVVQQQYAWALNRCGQEEEAERVMTRLLAARPSSETYGLLGRVYKDRWTRAETPARRAGLLARAVEVYLKGFEHDMRDPYPGVNAVTLMFLSDPPDPRLPALLPVVRYAADRAVGRTDREPDYWDHASVLNLAVLADDRDRAARSLQCAVAVLRDDFEARTTARDLSWVADALRRRGQDADWVQEIVEELTAG